MATKVVVVVECLSSEVPQVNLLTLQNRATTHKLVLSISRKTVAGREHGRTQNQDPASRYPTCLPLLQWKSAWTDQDTETSKRASMENRNVSLEPWRPKPSVET